MESDLGATQALSLATCSTTRADKHPLIDGAGPGSDIGNRGKRRKKQRWTAQPGAIQTGVETALGSNRRESSGDGVNTRQSR